MDLAPVAVMPTSRSTDETPLSESDMSDLVSSLEGEQQRLRLAIDAEQRRLERSKEMLAMIERIQRALGRTLADGLRRIDRHASPPETRVDIARGGSMGVE